MTFTGFSQVCQKVIFYLIYFHRTQDFGGGGAEGKSFPDTGERGTMFLPTSPSFWLLGTHQGYQRWAPLSPQAAWQAPSWRFPPGRARRLLIPCHRWSAGCWRQSHRQLEAATRFLGGWYTAEVWGAPVWIPVYTEVKWRWNKLKTSFDSSFAT